MRSSRMCTARSLPYRVVSVPKGVSVWGSLSWGVSVQGGLCPGESLSGDLCLGVSVQGVSVWVVSVEVSLSGGGSVWGLCLSVQGVSVWVFCISVQGVSVSLSGGSVSLSWGLCPGYLCQGDPRQRPPPLPLWTKWLTHTCENITLPQTSVLDGKKVKRGWSLGPPVIHFGAFLTELT